MTFRQDVYIRVHYMKSNVARRRPRRRCPSVRSFLNHPMQQRRALPDGHGIVEVGENLRSDVAHELPDGVLSPLLALLDARLALVDALGAAVLPDALVSGVGAGRCQTGLAWKRHRQARLQGVRAGSRRAVCRRVGRRVDTRVDARRARRGRLDARGDPRATGGNICERVCGGTRGAGDAPEAWGGGDLSGAEEGAQRHRTADGRPDGVDLRLGERGMG